MGEVMQKRQKKKIGIYIPLHVGAILADVQPIEKHWQQKGSFSCQ